MNAEGHRLQDAIGSGEPATRSYIEHGTVGWDDGSELLDLGTDTNGGRTFIRVQLFRGADPASVPDPGDGAAHGYKIKARISGPMWHVPPRGTHCLVAFPEGLVDAPGLGVIIALPDKNPSIQFSGSRAVLDFGPDMDVVIKGKSVVISDYENRYFSVGPETGIKCGDADANGFCLKAGQWLMYTTQAGNARSCLKLAGAEASLALNDGKVAFVKLSDGKIEVAGTKFVAATASGYLGLTAVAASPIAYSAAGPVNLISASWFVAPA